MQTMLKKNFTKVANVKPPASRSDFVREIRGGHRVQGP